MTTLTTTTFTTDDLIAANIARDWQQVKNIIQSGVDVNFESRYGWTTLHHATQFDHDDLVKFLIDAGADVNAKDRDGWTPADVAVRDYAPNSLNVLLNAGADVNAKNKDGFTLLHILVADTDPDTQKYYDQEEILDILLMHGADINAKDNNGRTPLHYGVINNNVAALSALVRRDADVTVRDCFNKRAVDYYDEEIFFIYDKLKQTS